MHVLRHECPWDAEQTHASLVNHLIEETGEVVEAIETGTDADLREELGDLLLQVFFHSEIAAETGRFTVDDVADGIADKLIRRHPHIFAGEDAPVDKVASWEQRKKQEKGRRSALDGIASPLAVLARAGKVVSRTRAHGVGVELPDEPITADEVGTQIVALVARAQASGVDADQATRAALRALEARIQDAERAAVQGDDRAVQRPE
ncbi:MazG family protein [Nigerium massiliense]|uniref:MazG family protein n=1 Tax=Nigerium massiliense TaxID=1522317 RepID=UPI00069355AD|nr:MazG family protein [Nigerium massiliense]